MGGRGGGNNNRSYIVSSQEGRGTGGRERGVLVVWPGVFIFILTSLPCSIVCIVLCF